MDYHIYLYSILFPLLDFEDDSMAKNALKMHYSIMHMSKKSLILVLLFDLVGNIQRWDVRVRYLSRS